jgi:hypothetical protein
MPQYKIVRVTWNDDAITGFNAQAAELERRVAAYIQQGWVPIGGAGTVPSDGISEGVFQAMWLSDRPKQP